jgi:hypothetical protein
MIIDRLNIPKVLLKALKETDLLGDYKLSGVEDWLQPYEMEEVNWGEFAQPFDGETTISEGLLTGAIRICNTGCEGYHLYIFSGNDEGSIWSDQRYPFGRLTRICDNIENYLENLRYYGRDHITHYE